MSSSRIKDKAQCAQTQVHHGCCHQKETFRRACGCLKTSDKLKQILAKLPAPPPPTPATPPLTPAYERPRPEHLSTLEKPTNLYAQNPFASSTIRNSACVNRLLTAPPQPFVPHYPAYAAKAHDFTVDQYKPELLTELDEKPTASARARWLLAELVQLLQLFVTATALMMYYLIYCYMQLVYFTLQTAIYFHNADGPMKVTIAIVTLSALLVAFNLMMRVERCSWHGCKHDAYTHYP